MIPLRSRRRKSATSKLQATLCGGCAANRGDRSAIFRITSSSRESAESAESRSALGASTVSEGAVAGVGAVDPNGFAAVDVEVRDVDLQRNRAFVAADVDVAVPGIDVRVAGAERPPGAGRVVTVVDRERAGLDN